MNIVNDSKIAEKKVTLAEIPVGTVFIGRVDKRKSTFLKVAYQRIVDLQDPEHTYSGNNLPILKYKELHAVLHVTEKK